MTLNLYQMEKENFNFKTKSENNKYYDYCIIWFYARCDHTKKYFLLKTKNTLDQKF